MRASAGKILKKIYERLYGHYGPQGWWPADTAFEVMVGAILTQNTAWSNVEKAIANLKRAGALRSPDALFALDERRLARLIRPAGYYNVKAKRLKNFLRYLSGEYGLKLKDIRKRPTAALRLEFLGVNGVGPETCDSMLLYALNRPVFVVDAYTKRIFTRHRIAGPKADYHALQELFMKNLPVDERLFNEYHALIVRLGKDFCRKSPRCLSCPLKNFLKI